MKLGLSLCILVLLPTERAAFDLGDCPERDECDETIFGKPTFRVVSSDDCEPKCVPYPGLLESVGFECFSESSDCCSDLDEPCEDDSDCCTSSESDNFPGEEMFCGVEDPGVCHPYVTIFAPTTQATLEAYLFSMYKGEEREKMIQKYKNDQLLSTRRGTCENPRSKHHGKTRTLQECADESSYLPGNQIHPDATYVSVGHQKNAAPWTSPDTRHGQLLAPNPGIWSFDDFLSEEEVEKVLRLVDKYGHDMGMLGPCRDAEADSINAHPGDGKTCFKISSDKVCKAPYVTEDCPMEPEVEDVAFVNTLKERVKKTWLTDSNTGPYAKFQVTSGGTSPMHLHYDERTVSFLVYLSDGGASTIFTNANVTVTPKRGKAYTWLNYDKDGNRNRMADHAIQAQPHDAEDRVVISFVIRTPPPQFLASQYTAEA